MGKRAPSAYFVFCSENRADAKKACVDLAGGEKVSVAVVAKELGRRWEALTPDEKQTYKDKVQQAAEDQPDAEEAADAGEATATPSLSFPAATVRRIMCLDSEVKRVSQDAVTCTAMATRAFVEELAQMAYGETCRHKRHTVRFNDVLAVAQQDARLADMGLRDVLLHESTFACARGDAGARKGKPAPVPQGGKSISTFFKAAVPSQTSPMAAA